jgi:predicted RNase H-like HicB family nuclease
MERITFEAKIQAAIKWDDTAKIYVSYAPALRLYSQAKTEDGAKEALKSAIGLYLKVAYTENVLEKSLRRRGFLLASSPGEHAPADNTVTVLREKGFTTPFHVPASLSLASLQVA